MSYGKINFLFKEDTGEIEFYFSFSFTFAKQGENERVSPYSAELHGCMIWREPVND